MVNAHREGHILCATISSVKRAISHADACGLSCVALVVLDNPDNDTREIVLRECDGFAEVHEVNFKDLAYSRNYATETSTGKYTTFLDGDDLWCKSWLVESYVAAERSKNPTVIHPEYNIYFDGDYNHVFHHVDMDDSDFEHELIFKMNYWTALSFAETSIYKNQQYRKNNILEGFGYEDWTWNYETISQGIVHKIAPGTVHFIRKGSLQNSLLAQTNKVNALPRISNLYRRNLVLSDISDYESAKLKCEQKILASVKPNDLTKENVAVRKIA